MPDDVTKSSVQLRPLEMGLSTLASVLILGGFIYLRHLPSYPVATYVDIQGNPHVFSAAGASLLFPVIFVLAQPVLSLLVARGAPNADELLLPAVVFLAGLGMLFATRLGAPIGASQAKYVLAAEVIFAAILLIPLPVGQLRRLKYWFVLLGLLLLVVLLGSGGGAGKKVFIPLLLTIFLAGFLEDKHKIIAHSSQLFAIRYLSPMLIVVGAMALGLAVVEHDLGSMLLLFGTFLSVIFVGSRHKIHAILVAGGGVAAALLALALVGHVRTRFAVWWDPVGSYHRNPDDAWQLWQGWIAFASGGVGGQGLGGGYPFKVPVVANDLILAGIGEELGLIGVVVVLSLLLFIVFRGLTIALWTRDRFLKLLALGLASGIAVQTLVIAGGTLRVMPLTGVPLPLVSTGGSSVVAGYVTAALLLRVSSAARSVPT